jgi:thioredoxin reductase (NADPH)
MPNELAAVLLYCTPLLIIVAYYGFRRKRVHHLSQQALAQAKELRLFEPPSLHPIVDYAKCLGCGSCVSACPETNILGLIDRQAHLVNPTDCIGHGACKSSCPHDAITLVFGSENKGVDIPALTPEFQTNISGLFIAGELGGMGLIKSAIEQGNQAMNAIAKFVGDQSHINTAIDCLIVGAGPAGISAMLGAKQKRLKVVTIDQSIIGGTVSHYPRGKLVMTDSATMPLVGKVKFGEISKEKLLAFWSKIINQHQLAINQNETMLDIQKNDDGTFVLTSDKNQYHSKSILLAMGRRGTPRKLGVKGEEQSKVVYQLTDAQQYNDDDVLVVGGGDSALEAACSIAELNKCRVWLSYRNDSFGRAKAKNRQRVEKLVDNDQLNLCLSSTVVQIMNETVELKHQGRLGACPRIEHVLRESRFETFFAVFSGE